MKSKPARPQAIQLPLDFGMIEPTTLAAGGWVAEPAGGWVAEPVDGWVAEPAEGWSDELPERAASTRPAAWRGMAGHDPYPGDVVPTGLPELTDTERLAAELEIVGLDASRHVVSDHLPFLEALGVTFSADLLTRRSRSELLIAGVKVATQTPPVRSGRRVIFLTLDDSTGPADATFFEDAQGAYASTVFNSWLLVVRGELRRTGPRGVSVRATGAWDLSQLQSRYSRVLTETGDPAAALQAVRDAMAEIPEGFGFVGEELTDAEFAETGLADAHVHGRGGGMGRRRVLVHASGFKQSPYADVKPAGESLAQAPRKLWHSSPGSSGP